MGRVGVPAVGSKDGDRGDEETFDRSFLGLDEPCRTLMAPKLRAKSQGYRLSAVVLSA